MPAGRADPTNVPGRPGFVPGGFRVDQEDVRSYEDVRRERRAYTYEGRTYVREPGRLIVVDQDTYFIRHDENERFRQLYGDRYRTDRRADGIYGIVDMPDGGQIVTIVDEDGRLRRRYRRFPDGRELILVNNGAYGSRPIYEDVVRLGPPEIRLPPERYLVPYDTATEETVYETLTAAPVVSLTSRYTLDQVRYSPDLRARMPSVELNTVTFEFNSFMVTPDQASRLSVIAGALNRAIKANPAEVFLVEGYTDAVGNDIDNLSLSDRRAQAVAQVLTQRFGVPPENLNTQGYGKQYLKVNTQGPSRENRRVVVRRVTPLINQGQADAR